VIELKFEEGRGLVDRSGDADEGLGVEVLWEEAGDQGGTGGSLFSGLKERNWVPAKDVSKVEQQVQAEEERSLITLTIAVHPAAIAPRRGTRSRVIGSEQKATTNDQLEFANHSLETLNSQFQVPITKATPVGSIPPLEALVFAKFTIPIRSNDFSPYPLVRGKLLVSQLST